MATSWLRVEEAEAARGGTRHTLQRMRDVAVANARRRALPRQSLWSELLWHLSEESAQREGDYSLPPTMHIRGGVYDNV